jgi:hypothetical protein
VANSLVILNINFHDRIDDLLKQVMQLGLNLKGIHTWKTESLTVFAAGHVRAGFDQLELAHKLKPFVSILLSFDPLHFLDNRRVFLRFNTLLTLLVV